MKLLVILKIFKMNIKIYKIINKIKVMKKSNNQNKSNRN